jgi:hypothetical protein
MTSLAGVLPETAQAYNALDAFARSNGITIGVADFGGVRTQSDTTKILGYRQDDYAAALRAGQISADTTLQAFRPIAPFGSSYHNYGAAFDVHIIARPSGLTEYNALQRLGAYAPSIGLRWGGTFPNPDTPHFELAIPLADAKQRYTSYASSGGASSTASDIASAFDLASFLPGLGPSTDDVAAAIDAPDYLYSGDDSGVGALTATDSQPPVGLFVIGAAVVGLVWWALRRKFT